MGGWSERVMGQKGFFDVERRLEAISAKGDPLETIKKIVRWEDFRTDIESAGWFSSSGWRLCQPEYAHGWSPCGIVQRTAWSPARHQNGPRSGAHLGTSPALVRSAKAESPKPAIVRGASLGLY